MFFCNDCAEKQGWPDSFLKSRGLCEVCHKTSVCNDVPSSALPWPKTMSDDQIAEAEATIEQISLWEAENGRYFLTENGVEREVSLAEWVRAERRAGFFNTMGHPHRPATGGFSDGEIKGRREYV